MQKKNAKQKILDASVKVFAEKGYNGSTTKEIAEIAGVSEGSVFKYYKTKRDILLAALNRVIDIFSDDKTIKPLEAILDAYKDSPPEAVFIAIAKDRAELFRENSELFKIILTESLFDKTLNSKFSYAIRTKLFPALHEHIRAGARAGVLRDLGPEGDMVAMRAFISMVVGYVLQRSFAPGLIPVDEEKDLAMMVDFFVKGISK